MEKSVVNEVLITKIPIKKETLNDDIKVRYKYKTIPVGVFLFASEIGSLKHYFN